VERVAPHIATVEDGLDILRAPPPTDDELSQIRAELDAARERRDQLSGPLDSLRYIEDHLPELGWSDAPTALAEKQTLRPALEEQVRAAEADLGRAEEGERAAVTALEDAVASAQKAQAALDQLDAALDLDRKQLAESAIADASDEPVATAERHHRALRDRASGLDERERTLAGEVAEAKVRHEQQAEDVAKLRSVREDEKAQWRPVADRWQRLQTEAEEAGVLHGAMTQVIIARTRSAGSVNLYRGEVVRGVVPPRFGGHLLLRLASYAAAGLSMDSHAGDASAVGTTCSWPSRAPRASALVGADGAWCRLVRIWSTTCCPTRRFAHGC
jgi:hypothetical protein